MGILQILSIIVLICAAFIWPSFKGYFPETIGSILAIIGLIAFALVFLLSLLGVRTC